MEWGGEKVWITDGEICSRGTQCAPGRLQGVPHHTYAMLVASQGAHDDQATHEAWPEPLLPLCPGAASGSSLSPARARDEKHLRDYRTRGVSRAGPRLDGLALPGWHHR